MKSKAKKKTPTRKAAMKKRRSLPAGVPNPIDIHVGSRVRLRRTLLGLSQEALSDQVGLSFPQIQKYERGANRMGASRLYQMSRILDVPITYFFEGMPAGLTTVEGQVEKGKKGNGKGIVDPMARRETLELVRSYYKISQPGVRKRIFELVKATGSALDIHA